MRFAFAKAAAVGCVCVLAALAQQPLSVDKLIEFIQSSISQKMQDKEVANYLTNVKLTGKLDVRTVEDLQGRGAGPKTVAALNRLAEASANLAPPPPKAVAPQPKPIPPPSYEEQQKVLNEVREYALNYSKSLPDFISLQVTRRYYDRNCAPGGECSWATADRLSAKLSYFEQHEKYELLTANDTSLFGKPYESVGGAISTGEFGTVLKEIFDPATSAEFRWVRWGMLRGHLCHVYSYSIDQPHSKEVIDYERQQQVTPAYHGLVFVEKGPNVILRVTVEPDIPVSFPIQEVHEVIDYNYVDISGQKFLLPLVAEVRMRHDRFANKNDIEFRGYRKYTTESNIKFEDAEEPVPDDQKKEQQPKQ
jgi:hypothetical protein